MFIHLISSERSGGGTDVADLKRRLVAAGAVLVDDPDEAERIAVATGDGYVGEAAERAAGCGVPLAVIPAGTANDFARANGLPADWDAAVPLAVRGTRVSEHELGRIDGRPFVNTAAAGLSPSAARRATPLKRRLGPLAYPVGAVLAGALDRPLECRIDAHFEGRAWQVIVACTGAFGGGAGIDAANQFDGMLDLFVLPDRGRRVLVRHARALRRGDLADEPDVVHVRDDAFAVRFAPGTFVNVDGELDADADGTLRCTVDARHFGLVVP